MKPALDEIEARLRAFIESSAQFLPGSSRQDALARVLVAEIQNAFFTGLDDEHALPTGFTIFTHPDNLPHSQSLQQLFDSLGQVIQELAQETGIKLNAPLTFTFTEDANLATEEIRIFPFVGPSPVETTNVLELAGNSAAHSVDESNPSKPYLIIGGKTVFPLQQPVINLGRRLDNHLIIDNPRVSRSHAQLRLVRGRYLIFDLNSNGGTFVNGKRITQHTLAPGDVISLAGYAIIYGEDNPETSAKAGGKTANLLSESD